MDASGEVADLMVKESIQLTEESIKLLAAGCKNLTAFLYALAKDNKKLVGKTSMKRLLREGKELKTFCIKAEDLNDFRKYAKPNILFAAIRDTKEDDGVVALVTNTDFVSPVNLFMQRRGYPAPTQTQEDDTVKKDAPRTQPRVPQEKSSPERGNGSTPSRTSQMPRTTDTAEKISDIPTVKGRLAVLQKTAAGMRDGQAKQRSQPTQQKSR